MAEDVGKGEITISGREIPLAPVFLFEEMEAVTESVRGDDIAGVRFKDGMHLQHLAILAGPFIPSREHLLQILFDDGLDPADAGVGEEAIDAVSAHTMRFMVDSSNDGVRGYTKLVSLKFEFVQPSMPTPCPLSNQYRLVRLPSFGWEQHIDKVRVVEVNLIRIDAHNRACTSLG